MEHSKKEVHGILAEFRNPRELKDIAETVRDSGYSNFDTYAPFPIHGMEDAMGVGKSQLGWIVVGGGLTGGLGALALMIWVMTSAWPLNISGKPLLDIPIYVPITFELTVLLSSFAAMFGLFFLNGLPTLNRPLFNVDRFKKASDDGFFICIESKDSLFSEDAVMKLFTDAGATHIETVYDLEE